MPPDFGPAGASVGVGVAAAGVGVAAAGACVAAGARRVVVVVACASDKCGAGDAGDADRSCSQKAPAAQA